MSHRLFVSYRRSDVALVAPAITWLRRRYGRQVFVDVDALLPGTRFDQRLLEAAGGAHVLVALIGPGWSAAARDGALHHDHDYVRQELAAALSAGVTVLPVLLDHGEPPTDTAVPPELQPLPYLQMHDVRSATANEDLHALCEAIDAQVQTRIDELRQATDWEATAHRLVPKAQPRGGNLAQIARLLAEQLEESDVSAVATGRWGRRRAQHGFVVVTDAAAYLIEVDDEYQAVHQVRIPCTDRPRVALEHRQRIAFGRRTTHVTITSDAASERIERVFRVQAYNVRDAIHRCASRHV